MLTTPDGKDGVFAAINSLKASRWELWGATLFGSKVWITDDAYRYKFSQWRGHCYLLKREDVA